MDKNTCIDFGRSFLCSNASSIARNSSEGKDVGPVNDVRFWVESSLHIYDDSREDDKLLTLEQWKAKWSAPKTTIKDEYGKVVAPDEMVSVGADRGRENREWEDKPVGYDGWAEFHNLNESERGPNGLLRHRIGRHCKAHGKGTWDLISGDFS